MKTESEIIEMYNRFEGEVQWDCTESTCPLTGEKYVRTDKLLRVVNMLEWILKDE